MEIETLKEEVNLLYDLAKDLSFDLIVLQDAKDLIEVKNKEIVNLGGTPIIVEPIQQIGISDKTLLEKLRAKLSTLALIKGKSKTAESKYNTLNLIFRTKSGVSYDEFSEKGMKFFYGGTLSAYNNFVMSNLIKTNQFFYLRDTDKDSVLKYTTPNNSVLYQVLLPKTNVAYALVYPFEKNTIVDIYKDEYLKEGLGLTYSFTGDNSQESFNNQYLELSKKLEEIENKYYN
jgi:hypothetical protein